MLSRGFFRRTLRRPLKIYRNAVEVRELSAIPRAELRHDKLRGYEPGEVAEILKRPCIDRLWRSDESSLRALGLPDSSMGVNSGDRRAIYYLTLGYKVKTVLEIGTHIGAAMIHIAAGLKRQKVRTALDTVDVVDVNGESARPGLEYGFRTKPSELVNEVGMDYSVNFFTEPGLNYLQHCEKAYDLIFLDGNHAATAVYQELALALKLLNPGGLVLLHDFFPNGKPIWPSQPPICGPYIAVKRAINENPYLKVIGLGELPWKTKLGSNSTSLALVVRINRKDMV
jgi:predicted O-methyltransferase YrrM